MRDLSMNLNNLMRALIPSAIKWGLGALALLVAYVFILATHYFGSAGYYLRFDSILWLLFVAAIFFIMRDRYAVVLIITLMVLLCGMVLSGVWRSGVSDHSLIAGVLPFSDAAGYADGSLNLLHSGSLTGWASRRPLTALIEAFLLFLCNGNFRAMLAALVLLSAISMALAVSEFHRISGRVASFVMFAGLFIFYRRFIGTTLSEHFGVIYGCLAVALVLRTLRTCCWRYYIIGLFCLSIGLLARAGAFFVLPMLVLVLVYVSWSDRRKMCNLFATAVLAVVLAFSLNKAVGLSLGNADASMGNFSYTLYGLVSGGDWTQVNIDHPEIKSLSPEARYQKIYELAFARIQAQPSSLITGGLRAYRDFFLSMKGVYGFSLFMPIERFILESGSASDRNEADTLVHRVLSQPFLYVQTAAALLLFLGCNMIGMIGLITILRERSTPSMCYLGASMGILASVPFVPPWDADWMRAYAATIPFVLVYPAVGMATVCSLFLQIKCGMKGLGRDENRQSFLLPFCSVLILIIPLVALLMFNLGKAPFLPHARTVSGGDYALQIIKGSATHFVDTIRSSDVTIQVLPDTADRNMKVYRHGYHGRSKVLESFILPGKTVALAYDINSRRMKYIVCEHVVYLEMLQYDMDFVIVPLSGETKGRWLRISKQIVSPLP
jgi:hypothetical protein